MDEMQVYKDLLSDVYDVYERYKEEAQKTGSNFNVFEVLGIETREIYICRLIYGLLNFKIPPDERRMFLDIFSREVLNLELEENVLVDEREPVRKEESTDENRRIDLWIETSKIVIPIEVKINAGDLNKQCKDYYNFASKYAKERGKEVPYLFYLTQYGDEPSEESAEGIDHENIQCISFRNEIFNWLEACRRLASELHPVCEIVEQFLTTVNKFTNRLEIEKMKDLKKIIVDTKENAIASADIKLFHDSYKDTMIKSLFAAIEKDIEKRSDKKPEKNRYDYRKYKTYPGISYLLQSDSIEKKIIQLWVRAEISSSDNKGIYIGICITVNGEHPRKNSPEYFIKLMKGLQPSNKMTGWWIEGHKKVRCRIKPDFSNLNEDYFQLFDDTPFNELVEATANEVLSIISNQKWKGESG